MGKINSVWVGKGWKMGSDWASAEALRGRVINDGLASKVPYGGASHTEEEGATETEISNQLAISSKVKGSYGMFSASVKASFSTSYESKTSEYFKLSSYLYGCNAIRINQSPANIIKSNDLSSDFLAALATDLSIDENVAKLFDNYGTHVVVGALEGGVIQAGYHASSMEEKSSHKFSTELEASYGALISGSAGVEGSSSKQVGTTHMSLNVQAKGGHNALNVPNGGAQAYSDWEASVSTSPTIVGVLADGLVPVWEFSTDSLKKQQILKYYIQQYGMWPALQIRVFDLVSTETHHPEITVTVPSDYKVISGGAKAEYGNGGGQLLTSSAPHLNNQRKWTAKSKDHTVSSPGTVTAFAVALWDPDNDWDVKVFSHTSDKKAHPTASVAVDAGYVMTGGGATDNYVGSGNLLVGMYPSSNNEWTASGKDHFESDPSTITSYAIGIKPNNKDYIAPPNRIFKKQSAATNHPATTVKPDGLWGFVGGGALDEYGDGDGNMLVASYPTPIGQISEWSVKGKDQEKSDPANIMAYGIGIEGIINITEDPT